MMSYYGLLTSEIDFLGEGKVYLLDFVKNIYRYSGYTIGQNLLSPRSITNPFPRVVPIFAFILCACIQNVDLEPEPTTLTKVL